MWERYFQQRAYIWITRSRVRWYVRKKNPSLAITNCLHSACLVIPISDPRDGFSIQPSHSWWILIRLFIALISCEGHIQVKILKIVSIIRIKNSIITNCAQTNSWHREEESHNNHKTPWKQKSSQLSLPLQDDCKTGMDIKQRTTKYRTMTASQDRSNNQQLGNNKQNHCLRNSDPVFIGSKLRTDNNLSDYRDHTCFFTH